MATEIYQYILECEFTCVGAGSVELLIDNVSKGVATESKPLFYLPLSASTQINLLLTGG